MKKYNIINNVLGWACFVIALVSYWMTLEPTASFWDCPEFISQGFKLEVGHPPGNPIFMLTARFFVNFVGGDITKVAIAVNAMSGLLSALTILLLFWTITHLVRRILLCTEATEATLPQMLVIFGSGICGALMYAWSDTFWFSAVEGEVYAFSSFCTALVFWLILKWENRSRQPHSDRYLVLIAYVIGISIAVHLLNLLCIPAIVLVVYYRRCADTGAKATAKGSLLALLVSFILVALILYGLVPGFIEVAQYFELFFVNVVGMSYNMGVLIYAVLVVASFVWGIYELYSQRSTMMIKVSFTLCVLLSGIPFIGSSWLMPVLILGALIIYFAKARRISVRVLTVSLLSIFVIFIGYSSYALLLIRSTANPPMNQNAPDNVFDLSTYLNREQYGDTPLLYGRTPASTNVYRVIGRDMAEPIVNDGKSLHCKVVKASPDEPDRYVFNGYDPDPMLTPELNMLFPRIYSSSHVEGYKGWIGLSSSQPLGNKVQGTYVMDADGNTVRSIPLDKPTVAQNFEYFLGYQLNHMYWRYFMWNFAGRQNDIQGNGEPNNGNWISGIPFIDNPRLGDQSLLPDDMGKDNKGHNVFFMIPLIMGILGLLWQAFVSRRGIEQFWVVFFLFFMTGIAIVLYLNQTPGQPRERDYAYAGSFYAYAIWVGMGVACIAHLLTHYLFKKKKTAKDSDAGVDSDGTDYAKFRYAMPAAVIALVVGILVPIQVVSQTWDDHDRSGRYVCRDFGFNYLNSLDDDAIIFTNGDNDTFPLWYAQEVEGVRTDVKVVNLSYLTTSWYADQIRHPSYDAPAIATIAKSTDYGYDKLQYNVIEGNNAKPVDAGQMLRTLYATPKGDTKYDYPRITTPNIYFPVDLDAAVKAGRISEAERAVASDSIVIDLSADRYVSRGVMLNNVLAIDMLYTSLANGWNRPMYFASTVPEDYYISLQPYLRSTGMAFEISPINHGSMQPSVNTDKMYRNVTERFVWGGLDKVADPKDIYLDETVRRMVSSTRSQIVSLAEALYAEGVQGGDSATVRKDRLKMAVDVLDLMTEKLPVVAAPYTIQMGLRVGTLYCDLGKQLGDKALTEKGLQILFDETIRQAQMVVYAQSLKPWQYENLQSTDLFCYIVYFPDLFNAYVQYGGDQQKILDNPTVQRINFQRLNTDAKRYGY